MNARRLPHSRPYYPLPHLGGLHNMGGLQMRAQSALCHIFPATALSRNRPVINTPLLLYKQIKEFDKETIKRVSEKQAPPLYPSLCCPVCGPGHPRPHPSAGRHLTRFSYLGLVILRRWSPLCVTSANITNYSPILSLATIFNSILSLATYLNSTISLVSRV